MTENNKDTEINSIESNDKIEELLSLDDSQKQDLENKVIEQEKKQPLLIVRNLNKYFKKGGTFFKAVNNANFEVYEGDFFGIIGESGSGKSTIGKLLIRLLQSDSGTTIFDNNIISDRKISKKLHKWLTTNMQMIFQDPMASLNPKKNVLNLIAEPLIIKKTLKKEVNDIWHQHNQINQFFQYTYKQKDFERSQQFDSYYFPEMIKVYEVGIKKVNAMQFDTNLKFDENKFNFISNLIDLDEKSKKINYSLYEYADSIKNIFYECKQLHDNKQNHPLEIQLFEKKKEISLLKNQIKRSPQYLELEEKLNQTQDELTFHLENSTEKYRDQIKNYIKGAKESYSKEIKTLKNQGLLINDFINGLVIKFKIQVKDTCIEALDFIDGIQYLSLTDAREIINKTDDYVNEMYKPIFDEIENIKSIKVEKDVLAREILLSNLNQQKDNNTDEDPVDTLLKEIKESSTGIDKKVTEINDQFQMIKEKFEELKVNEKLFSTNFFELFKIGKYDSYKLSQVDVKKTELLNKQIQLLKQQLSNAKHEYKNWKKSSTEYKELKQQLINSKADLERINVECKQHYANDINEFNKTIQPKIDDHSTKLKGWYKQLSKLKSQFKSATKRKMKEFISIAKKQYNTYDNKLSKEEIISFKNDIGIKLRTIDALTFEFQTIKDDVITYRQLRSKNKFLTWLTKSDLTKILMKKKVFEALNSVGLKNEHAFRYPHEFSGGQRQRIVIARALINNPKIIIADEPISALDVSIQAQVINIMRDLAEKKGITFLFIAHDLSMVNYACNRMIIMHNGRILEKGDTEEIFSNPIHPYTLSLLRSAPQLSKIHINLAGTNAIDLSYGNFNLPAHYYSFHSVNDSKEHFVFGTDKQIELWNHKKTH